MYTSIYCTSELTREFTSPLVQICEAPPTDGMVEICQNGGFIPMGKTTVYKHGSAFYVKDEEVILLHPYEHWFNTVVDITPPTKIAIHDIKLLKQFLTENNTKFFLSRWGSKTILCDGQGTNSVIITLLLGLEHILKDKPNYIEKSAPFLHLTTENLFEKLTKYKKIGIDLTHVEFLYKNGKDASEGYTLSRFKYVVQDKPHGFFLNLNAILSRFHIKQALVTIVNEDENPLQPLVDVTQVPSVDRKKCFKISLNKTCNLVYPEYGWRFSHDLVFPDNTIIQANPLSNSAFLCINSDSDWMLQTSFKYHPEEEDLFAEANTSTPLYYIRRACRHKYDTREAIRARVVSVVADHFLRNTNKPCPQSKIYYYNQLFSDNETAIYRITNGKEIELKVEKGEDPYITYIRTLSHKEHQDRLVLAYFKYLRRTQPDALLVENSNKGTYFFLLPNIKHDFRQIIEFLTINYPSVITTLETLYTPEAVLYFQKQNLINKL